MAGRVPLYLQIAEKLRQEIERGEVAPGASLGPQRALARRFGVTLMTVRQALACLGEDGLIRRQHGLGTFVAAAPIDYDMVSLRTFAGELAARGEPVETRLCRVGFEAPPRAVARALGPATRRVLVLERQRLVRGGPLCHQVTYVPAPLGRLVARHDLERHSLRHVLVDTLGLAIGHASETVSAARLDRRVARLLARRPGQAAFCADRITFSPRGDALLFDRVWIPGDRFRLTRELRFSAFGAGPTRLPDVLSPREEPLR